MGFACVLCVSWGMLSCRREYKLGVYRLSVLHQLSFSLLGWVQRQAVLVLFTSLEEAVSVVFQRPSCMLILSCPSPPVTRQSP